MSNSSKKDEDVENCEELDDDYFLSLGQTFSVVDAWNENEENNIKKDDDTSNHSKSSSSKRAERESSFKRSHSRDSKRDHRSQHDSLRTERGRFAPERPRSPERGRFASDRLRSPDRNRSREDERTRFRRQSPPRRYGLSPPRRNISPPRRNISPPRRNVSPPRRNISPPRRNAYSPPRGVDRRHPVSPPRKRVSNGSQKTFLEELQDTLAKQGKKDEGVEQLIQQGGRIDWNDVKAEPEAQRSNFPINPNQMQQPFNPMMMPGMPMMMNPLPFPPQVPIDMFGNPLLPPPIINVDVPQPVPPPNVAPTQNSSISPTTGIANNNSTQTVSKAPVTIIREYEEQPPAKKTQSAGLNLLDLLRKKSKKNIKPTAGDELKTKKTSVQNRCKEAVNLIQDLEGNKSKVPLVCVLSKQDIEHPKDTFNKSPLDDNQQNPTFLFQATKERCHTILEKHPLRNIYGPTAEIAQNLKMDLQELSLKVARDCIIKTDNREPAVVPAPPVLSLHINNNISNTNIVPEKKIVSKNFSKAVQTENVPCAKCSMMDETKRNLKHVSVQTNVPVLIDSEMQHDSQMEEGNGFRVFIDDKILQNRNFEQHHALEVFVNAFGLSCQYIAFNNDRGDRRRLPENIDDRLNYANPENPNRFVQEPVAPPSFFSTSPLRRNRSRSISPAPRRPQIFDRIGDKISEHSNSPRNFDDFDDLRRSPRSPFRSYVPLSPKYPRRVDSPGPSRRFRNRSRSRSRSIGRYRTRSRSISRSPKRHRRNEYEFMDRRGRY